MDTGASKTARAIALGAAGLLGLLTAGGGCSSEGDVPHPSSPALAPLGVGGGAALGTPCGDPSECASGYCAFGVCCNTECISYCGFDAAGCSTGICEGLPNPGYCWCPYCGPSDITSYDTPTFTCYGIPHCVCPTRADGSTCSLANGCGQCVSGKCEQVGYPDGTRCCTGQDCASGTCAPGLPWTLPPCGAFSGVCPVWGTCVGASVCASGDGQFCGAALGLDAGTLFQCTAGVISVAAHCPGGCQQNGNGNDACTCQPDGAPCDDGDACTQGDSFQSCLCTGGPPVICPPADECHEAGACNPQLGTCSSAPKPDGAPCSMGTCQQGTCVGSSTSTSSTASSTGGASSSGASSSGASSSGGGGSGPTGTTTGGSGASSAGAGAAAGGASPGGGGGGASPGGGGSCATTAGAPAAPAWIALVLALALRRRRR